MNKRQKEVELAKLAAEEKQLKHLQAIYKKSLDDVVNKINISNGKIKMLLSQFDKLDEAGRSMLQSQVYQKAFQENLKKQLDSFYGELISNQHESMQAYLKKCYDMGFVGSIYDMHGQGIPIIAQINQKNVIKAMNIDSKISTTLYTRLGEDVQLLKKRIANNISRGIATAASFSTIATNIADNSRMGINRAMRIARTEGHRIQSAAAFDAMVAAKDEGADVVKQWDAALDDRTRDTHRQLDGQIRELDEPFEVDGMTAMFPSDFGDPAEDINCRCAVTQRAKWALDEDELDILKERAAYYGLDKTKSFEEFAKKYNIAIKNETIIPADIRKLPEIDFEKKVTGLNIIENATLKNVQAVANRGTAYELNISKKISTAWDDASSQIQARLRYNAKRYGKPIHMDAGTYHVEKYVQGSGELAERLEIAKLSGSKYLGTTYFQKYNTLFDVDIYKKGDKLLYSMGKAQFKRNISEQSLKLLDKVIETREKIINGLLRKHNISNKTIFARKGDEWVDAMRQFHKAINADALPKIVSDAEYNSIKSPVLYRGIAPKSTLRSDITTTLSTEDMVHEFFKSDSPFPSRGIYGDGIAYAAPSMNRIAKNYATNGGKQPHGGIIMEFKLKKNAKVIEYEDAVELFKQISRRNKSKLLFNINQRASKAEVGKAMNALGYDAIIKHNGDNTGIDFYVILNRGALVTKKKYITKKY